jgi:hypothetical protein
MAKKKPKTTQPSEPPHTQISTATARVLNRADLPSIWIDKMSLNLRADPGLAMVRFYTLLVDEEGPTVVEACRIQTTADHLRKIVEVLAKSLNFYPTPESTSKIELIAK